MKDTASINAIYSYEIQPVLCRLLNSASNSILFILKFDTF